MSRLILSRSIGEEIVIAGEIVVRVCEVNAKGRVKLAFETSGDIPIYRREVADAMELEALEGPEKEVRAVAQKAKREAAIKSLRSRSKSRG